MKQADKYKLLITRYLSGEISAEDYVELDEWKNKSPDNLQLFKEYIVAWDLKTTSPASPAIDTETAWNTFEQKIEVPSEGLVQTRDVNRFTIWRKRWYAVAGIAALILSLFAMYFLLFQLRPADSLTHVAASTSKEPFLLEDGTEVFSRKLTTLSYPEKFRGNERRITLKGNAFFNVAHDPERPFIIDLDGAQVQVLGTSFQVSHHSTGEVEVAVVSGTVRLQVLDANENSMILNEGELGIFYPDTETLEKKHFSNMNFLAWKTGELVFDETELHRVFHDLETTYEIDIQTEADVSTSKLSARFQNESLEDIFKTIEMLYGLRIVMEKEVYYIRSSTKLDSVQQHQ